jgi:RNA polymerase sigma-70 factor (ECF subfamily)
MTATRELVQRARAGDAAAFEELVRGHYRAAYATARALTGNDMDAEDVVQDGFIRALERLDECDPDRFAGWVLAIVRNRAHNIRDRERVRTAAAIEDVDPAGPDRAEARTERGDLRAALDGALAELSPVQREVVLLHDMDGWRHREIAEALDMSEVMARQHLFQARKRLRQLLSHEELREYLP